MKIIIWISFVSALLLSLFTKAYAVTPGAWVDGNWVWQSSSTPTAYEVAVSTTCSFTSFDDFRNTMGSKILLLQKASAIKSSILAMRALITEDAPAYSVQVNNQIAKLQRQVDIIVAYAGSF